MNPIDRIVLFFKPQAGRDRLRARAQATQIMNFDAASKGRRTYGWKAPGGSADAAAYGNLSRIRNLSRDMIRNRPYARRASDVVVANVVGTGIMPSVKAGGNAKKTVQDYVDRHLLTPSIDSAGEYDLYEMQQVCMAAVFSDGEVLLRRRQRSTRYQPGLPLPYQVEVLEADYLDPTIQSNGENLVVDGVEYGPTGAIEAYHLYSEHPGAVRHRKALKSTRVHWSDVIHMRRFDRPGQLRGVPWLAPVMMTLGELSDYQEAQILKQRMAALMALVLKWEEGKRPKDAGGIEDLAPGAVVSLPEGADAIFSEPPTVDGYDEFMRRGLAACAVGIGITYESISGDLKGVNFSSGRMGRMEMDRLIRMWQRNVMMGQFCFGMARWFREGMALAGHAGIPFELMWTPPRRILVDPTKEVPAMIEEIDAGLNSRQGTQRELGRDPDEIRRERVEDAKADAKAGLSPVAAKSKPTAPVAADDETTKEEGDDDAEDGQ